MTQSGRPGLKNALATPRATQLSHAGPQSATHGFLSWLPVTSLTVVAAHLTNPGGHGQALLCSAIILG